MSHATFIRGKHVTYCHGGFWPCPTLASYRYAYTNVIYFSYFRMDSLRCTE